jgi:hypothetical protein
MMMCNCGRNEDVDLRGGYNVGAVMKKTGWFWVPSFDGGGYWVCPQCWVKVVPLINRLIGLLGPASDTGLDILFQIAHKKDQ